MGDGKDSNLDSTTKVTLNGAPRETRAPAPDEAPPNADGAAPTRAPGETDDAAPDDTLNVAPPQVAELRIGYLLPTRDWVVMDDRDLTSLVDQARLAEELGFDSVWAGDSPVTRPRADPLLVLAAAAALTERVTLGTAVLLPALRHPILLAHQLATLDLMSGGRLVAGMGAGFPTPNTEAEFEAIGVGFKRRVSRMEEAIHAMRRLWSEDEVSYQGTHFSFRDVRLAPRPARRGGPPIWLAGGGSDAALRRVARIADGWLPYPPDPRTYANEWTSITAERSASLKTGGSRDTEERDPGDTATRDTRRPDAQNASEPPRAKGHRADALSNDRSDRSGRNDRSDLSGTSHRRDGGDRGGQGGPGRSARGDLGHHGDRDRSDRRDLHNRGSHDAPTPALYATICLDDDPERARLRLRTSIERYYNAPLEVVEGIQAMFAGTPKDAAAWLQAYVEAGARHVVIRLAVDDHRAAMEEFAAQVLPLVRHA
ncbi:LLM class flavin-dependent oxidoreductase [Nonomuraea rhodomycinica]|uniref:LLM class flavin-dependent oxidoreductase n=1 Tax=Nonomuraea rhodomycinica TaxID=1712872 RepID=UPI001FE5B1D8|nr:LLM class flavin-dependent oxidoreductase [Nonomuraea rhodomycinica]